MAREIPSKSRSGVRVRPFARVALRIEIVLPSFLPSFLPLSPSRLRATPLSSCIEDWNAKSDFSSGTRAGGSVTLSEVSEQFPISVSASELLPALTVLLCYLCEWLPCPLVIKLNNIMGRFAVRLPARLAHHSDSSHEGSCAPSFRFESESDSCRLISLAPSALPLFACPMDERWTEGRKRKKGKRV